MAKNLTPQEDKFFKQNLKVMSLTLPKQALTQLFLYYQAFRENNQRLGLTSLNLEKNWEQSISELFLDSLILAPYFHHHPELKRVLDLGTGAGLPGLPLKIACPHLKLTLLDSSQKKLGFCHLMSLTLGLSDVTILEGRAEKWAKQPQQRESYDLVCSKAFSKLPSFLEYAIPFLKPGGLLAAYKGESIAAEIKQAAPTLQALQCRIKDLKEYTLPQHSAPRFLLLVEKMGRIAKNS